MSFDAFAVRAVSLELAERLTSARVEKVLQPSKDEIFLALHSGSEHFRLHINAGPRAPRIGITAESPENPKVPPMFCMLLRKHLTGSRVSAVKQIGFERVMEIELETYDEMGFFTKRRLIAEIMGRYSNCVLCDEGGRILGALRPVDFTTSSKRQLLPQMQYELPPLQEGKIDPFTETDEGFLAYFAEKGLDERAIQSRYIGFSPISAKEVVCRARGDSEPSREALLKAFKALLERTRKCEFTPIMVLDADGRPIDISCFDICALKDGQSKVKYASFGELTDAFFAEGERREREKSRAAATEKLLKNAENRLVKKLALQAKELADTEKKAEYKKKADLITANLYRFNGKTDKVTVTDYIDDGKGGYEEKEVVLTVERGLTASQAAQKLYKKYAKAKNAETEINAQIEKGRAELVYVRSVLDALCRVSGQAELDEIRAELAETGYIRAFEKQGKGVQNGKKRPEPKRQLRSPAKYETGGGFTVYVGKNNLQNDHLTFKLASKNDYWFHVKGVPGSHTVLICDGKEPSDADLTEAAALAAKNSKAADAGAVEVDYTKIRNVKKPTGARPGFVIYEGYNTALVRLDERK